MIFIPSSNAATCYAAAANVSFFHLSSFRFWQRKKSLEILLSLSWGKQKSADLPPPWDWQIDTSNIGAFVRLSVQFRAACPRNGNHLNFKALGFLSSKGLKGLESFQVFTENFSWPLFLAPRTGFEPAAYRLGGGRSIHLSYQGLLTCAR